MRVVNNSGKTLFIAINPSGVREKVADNSDTEIRVDRPDSTLGLASYASGPWVYFPRITDKSVFTVTLTNRSEGAGELDESAAQES